MKLSTYLTAASIALCSIAFAQVSSTGAAAGTEYTVVGNGLQAGRFAEDPYVRSAYPKAGSIDANLWLKKRASLEEFDESRVSNGQTYYSGRGGAVTSGTTGSWSSGTGQEPFEAHVISSNGREKTVKFTNPSELELADEDVAAFVHRTNVSNSAASGASFGNTVRSSYSY